MTAPARDIGPSPARRPGRGNLTLLGFGVFVIAFLAGIVAFVPTPKDPMCRDPALKDHPECRGWTNFRTPSPYAYRSSEPPTVDRAAAPRRIFRPGRVRLF